MTADATTLNEIRRAGIAALTQALGPVDTIRFLQQFENGRGDYTAERAVMLGNPPVDALLRQIAVGKPRHVKRKPRR